MSQFTTASGEITTQINNMQLFYDAYVLHLLHLSIKMWYGTLPEYFPTIFPPGHNFLLHAKWKFFGKFDEWCDSRDRYASIWIGTSNSVTFGLQIWPLTVECKLVDSGEYLKALKPLRRLGDELNKKGQDIKYLAFAWGMNVRFLRYYKPSEGTNNSRKGVLRHASVIGVSPNDEPVTYNLRIDEHRRCVARLLGLIRAGVLVTDFIE